MKLNISSIVVPFTLLLCLFQAVKPEHVQVSDQIIKYQLRKFPA